MNISKNGLDLIKKYEGCRLTAYHDAVGIPTIGYGHTSGVKMGTSISQAQADQFLQNDVNQFSESVTKYVTVKLNQNQFDALVSFAYNVGATNLKTSTLLVLVNKNDFKGAANEFTKWVHAKGKVLDGLVKRRAEEKALFEKPVSKPKPKTHSLKYPNEVFKDGSKGSNVEMIQRALNNAIGKHVLTVDGHFGKQTEKAVKDYQKRHKLLSDGIVGKKTWETLF